MITTRFTEMFGLTYPIMSAPMALHCGGTLAAAVSKAGALGSLGGLHPQKQTDWLLLNEIAHIRTTTDGPFAVGFISGFIPVFPTFFDAALEAKPPVIALSFGKTRDGGMELQRLRFAPCAGHQFVSCVNLYQTGAKSTRTTAQRTASPSSTRKALIDAGGIGLTNNRPYATNAATPPSTRLIGTKLYSPRTM
jgi:hypothetical protein